MHTNRLIEYLRLVQDLQKDKIILENTLNTIDYNLSNLDTFEHTIDCPKKKEQSIILNIIITFCCLLIPVAIVAYIIMVIYYALTEERIALIPLFVNENPFINLAISAVIISLSISCIASPIMSIQAKISNKQAEDQYKAQLMKEQNRLIQVRNTKDQLQTKKNTFNQMLDKTCTSLDALYDTKVGGQVILYPKYRDIVAVSMFLEYLESKRCSQLEGHEGAYNIFENEKLLNHIITKLDVIISKLDDIKQNQHCLYEALRDISSKETALYNEMQGISSSLGSIELNAQINATNTQSLLFIESLRVLKNGI